MAYTDSEANQLRACVKEIIDENYFSQFHEMKKKLMMAETKQQRLKELLEREISERKKFELCHQCHKLNLQYQDQGVQVDSKTVPTNPTLQNSKNSQPQKQIITPPADHHRASQLIHQQQQYQQKYQQPVTKPKLSFTPTPQLTIAVIPQVVTTAPQTPTQSRISPNTHQDTPRPPPQPQLFELKKPPEVIEIDID